MNGYIKSQDTYVQSTATTHAGGGGRNHKINIFSLDDNNDIIDKHKLLNSKHYLTILYMLFEKIFIYIKELERITALAVDRYLNNMIKLKLIEKCTINQDYESYLQSIKSYNSGNFNQIKFYKFTSEGYKFYSQPHLKHLVYSNVDKFVIDYIEDEKAKFKQFEKDKKLKEEELKKYNANRYKLYNSITYSKRSIEQHLFIAEYQREEI